MKINCIKDSSDDDIFKMHNNNKKKKKIINRKLHISKSKKKIKIYL